MKSTIIGMDIAKNVFQLHTVDPETGEIYRIKLRRDEVLPFFVKRAPALVALEACGGAHEWGRQLCSLGHEVRLLAPKSVRPFVLRNKSDAADARAIWTAVQQPEAHFVAVKTEQQQTVLALHRMREQLMKFRIMQTNALRGILYEFGIVLPSGYPALAKAWADAIASAAQRLSAILIVSLQEQWARVQSLDKDIAVLERRLADSLRRTEQCKKLIKIPGVGLLTATAAVATIGDPATFSSGRQFAAWLGLVPRQTGTGGRVRQLGLSKRGDVYMRTLLMHGARAIIARSKHSPWIEELLKRRPYSVAVAALANKLARTIWAVLFHHTPFDPEHSSGPSI
ncbi:IS110 family transposase [Janthinobacterium sp. PSPC3-1]|uniref:IS110 family transposase n=1 Tax=Janthinobacterium sp. PSPC3-1 TaxID=2804653 RepID=UPI003CEB3FD9